MADESIGRRRWVIAEGYIPGCSTGEGRAFESHETACLLNAGGDDARVKITIYFSDRDPVGPYLVVVPARRTLHLRFNDPTDPAPVPRDTDYASVIESDVSVVAHAAGYPPGGIGPDLDDRVRGRIGARCSASVRRQRLSHSPAAGQVPRRPASGCARS